MTRRRVWIYRRLFRNWYREWTGYTTRKQLDGLTDHNFLDRIA